ncbi:hypothetical protein [Sulfuricurvum sp.]|uniref:hypothetical protein n=1 Tax=Sulfuricurvum sp. TaxID=2025608 RepID=UPI002624A6C9|nr:hypothetical protein [Sulfuricurvum sp.]MDD4949633.1 hypothetical protein [Sulfuricurvum sp.]
MSKDSITTKDGFILSLYDDVLHPNFGIGYVTQIIFNSAFVAFDEHLNRGSIRVHISDLEIHNG